MANLRGSPHPHKNVLVLVSDEPNLPAVAAAILDIAPRTVAFHKYRIMEHFNLKSSAELVQFALRNKIIPG